MSLYSTQIIADGPVAYWPLSDVSTAGNAADLGPNNLPGTYHNSPIRLPGPIIAETTTAIALDGSTQYVSRADASAFHFTSGLSVECWFRSTATATQYLVNKYDNVGGWFIGISGGAILGSAYQSGGSNIFAATTSPNTYNDGYWHHVVLTWDETSKVVVLYVDGIAVYTHTASVNGIDYTQALAFGRLGSGAANFYQGNIGQVAVYGSALPATTVVVHYRLGIASAPQAEISRYAQAVLADKPVGYWRFDELSGTSATDASNNGNTGTYVGSPTLGVAGGILGDTDTAIALNGSSQYVTIVNTPALNPSGGDIFTLECWVRFTSVGAGVGPIFEKGTNGYGFFRSGDSIVLRRTGITTIAASTGVSLVAGVWTHVVATKNGSAVHLYINGVDVTGSVTNSTVVPTTNDLEIGFDGSNYCNGSLDECAIYQTALSRDRVLAHYLIGINTAPQFAPLVEFDFRGGRGEADYEHIVLDDVPVLYLPLTDAVGSTMAADSSGNSLTGTYQNMPIIGIVAGPIVGEPEDTAVQLDGSTQYVSVPNATLLNPGDVLSLEIWVNPGALPANQILIDKGANGYELYLTSAGTVKFAKKGVADIVASTVNLTVGSWFHILVTKNGSTVHVYLNGVDVTGSVSNQTIVSNSNAAGIGAASGGGTYFDGIIAHVCVYATALSATRVVAHYYAGIQTDTRGYYSFQGVSSPNKWYKDRIVSIGQVARQIQPQETSISLANATVDFSNVEQEFSGILATELSLQGLTVRLLFGDLIAGLAAMVTLFTGTVYDWQIAQGKLSVSFRDSSYNALSSPMRTLARCFNTTDFPNLPASTLDLIPIVYGHFDTHSGTYGPSSSGVSPCFLVDPSSTANPGYGYRYIAAQHALRSIDNVYVYGTLISPTLYTTGTATYNGLTMTYIDFSYDPRDSTRTSETEVTIDCQGKMDAAGNMIENPATQFQDFLETFCGVSSAKFNTTWATVARQCDNVQFKTAFSFNQTSGANLTPLDISGYFNESANLYLYSDRFGLYGLVFLSPHVPAPANATLVTDRDDVIQNSLQVTPNKTIYSRLTFSVNFNWKPEKNSFEYNVPSVGVDALMEPVTGRIALAWSPHLVRGNNDYVHGQDNFGKLGTAIQQLYSATQHFVQFDLPPDFYNADLGNGYTLTHWQGVGKSGFGRRGFFVIGLLITPQPSQMKITMVGMLRCPLYSYDPSNRINASALIGASWQQVNLGTGAIQLSSGKIVMSETAGSSGQGGWAVWSTALGVSQTRYLSEQSALVYHSGSSGRSGPGVRLGDYPDSSDVSSGNSGYVAIYDDALTKISLRKYVNQAFIDGVGFTELANVTLTLKDGDELKICADGVASASMQYSVWVEVNGVVVISPVVDSSVTLPAGATGRNPGIVNVSPAHGSQQWSYWSGGILQHS